MEKTFNRIKQTINAAKNILLISHVSPDGDTIGSALGLYHGIRNHVKAKITLFCHDELTELLQTLPGSELYTNQPADGFDLIVTLDCADTYMTGAAEKLLAASDNVINIDHHVSNTRFGTINCVADQGSATSSLVYTLLTHWGYDVDSNAADCLYAGMVTDTGRFSYAYTTPNDLRIAADLIEAGANFADICYRFFVARTLARAQIIARMYSTMQLYDGKIGIAVVAQSDLEETGATAKDTANIVNEISAVDTIDVAALLMQIGENTYKVSFRASANARVDTVAVSLGGGGHHQASGCTIQGSRTQAVEKVLAAIRSSAFLPWTA